MGTVYIKTQISSMQPKHSKRIISTNELFSELFLYFKKWQVLGGCEIERDGGRRMIMRTHIVKCRMQLQRGKGENSKRILCITLIKIFEKYFK